MDVKEKNNTEKTNAAAEPVAEDLNEVMRIRREKLAALVAEGKNPFEITKFPKTHDSSDVKNDFERLENTVVSLAGRIISVRIMGKASFCHILDGEGSIQLYVRRDELGDEDYAAFKSWDIGDIIGVKGVVFRTHMGEISVRAEKLTLLSKSLRPLPEKVPRTERYGHALQTEIRRPHCQSRGQADVVIRSKIISCIREYLDGLGYIEVETPVLNTIPGGANARPFVTHHNTLDIDMYMRIATELYLKRLIVGGFEKVYEIGRLFRNEGMDIRHNPEFTTIELYQAYVDYNRMMEISQELFCYCADKVLGTQQTALRRRGNRP